MTLDVGEWCEVPLVSARSTPDALCRPGLTLSVPSPLPPSLLHCLRANGMGAHAHHLSRGHTRKHKPYKSPFALINNLPSLIIHSPLFIPPHLSSPIHLPRNRSLVLLAHEMRSNLRTLEVQTPSKHHKGKMPAVMQRSSRNSAARRGRNKYKGCQARQMCTRCPSPVLASSPGYIQTNMIWPSTCDHIFSAEYVVSCSCKTY